MATITKFFAVLIALVALSAQAFAVGGINNSYPIGPSGVFGTVPMSAMTSAAGASGTTGIVTLTAFNSTATGGGQESFIDPRTGAPYQNAANVSVEILGYELMDRSSTAPTWDWQILWYTGAAITEGSATAPSGGVTKYSCGAVSTYCFPGTNLAGASAGTVANVWESRSYHTVLPGSAQYRIAMQHQIATATSVFRKLWIREF